MIRRTAKSLILMSAITIACNPEGVASNLSARLTLSSDAKIVAEGRSVTLHVQVVQAGGTPQPDYLVLPYLNNRRWGAHELTDEAGQASITLPLPNPGLARVLVRAVPDAFDTHWIWTPSAEVNKAYLATHFELDEPCAAADLRAAMNGTCTLYVNGSQAGEAPGLEDDHVFLDVAPLLRTGTNTFAIEAQSAGGMPCVAAQLHLAFEQKDRYITTDRSWRAWETPPKGWPGKPAADGEPARSLARMRDTLWGAQHLERWPGFFDRDQLVAGRLLPEDACVSDTVEIEVVRRRIESRRDPDYLIGMQWGSYFYPGGFWWQTAQAVPLVGFYESYNRDIIRQHALWLMDMGIDFIYADWPIHIPPDADGEQHWRNRPERANLQIHSTAMTLEVYAEMRAEGYPVPGLVIMGFLANGPANTPEAVNEQLDWIYNYFIRNPRYEGLWVLEEGKPLIALLHNTMAPEDPSQLPSSRVDDTRFTIRCMGAQFQLTKMDQFGYWSWMDGVPEPIVTYRNGRAEAVTPTPAYFDEKGWLGPNAAGRRNGTTFLRSFMPALRERPRYILFHQWNEFTGQYEGHPYPGGTYGDTYSVELSDDIEPVSLTADGYRGDAGGWGFYYANIAKALVDLYKQPKPEDTLMAVYPPGYGTVVTSKTLQVGWETIGKAPLSYTVLLDGVKKHEALTGNRCSLDLSGEQEGDHVLTVAAEGARTRFRLSRDRLDDRLDPPIPLSVDVPFTIMTSDP